MTASAPRTLAMFCKVVDNYGDIGICWRLARQLRGEHGIAVTLWVDDLASFRRLHPDVDPRAAVQQIEGVHVRHWAGQAGTFTAGEVADIVIEFFGVELPPGYVEAMAQCTPRPVWLNLEGLSAEDWVEGCHALPSPHPRLPLTKHFFFPGFTNRTGGLLCEAGLDDARADFQSDPDGMAGFLAGLGVQPEEMDARLVSLFCYPEAPAAALFDVWTTGDEAVTCLAPEGVAVDAVGAFLGAAPRAGLAATRGALTLRVLPFVPQPDYDRLLWACELNFVRGEDSFVRAQWAGRPFVWHIYRQDANLHHKKLRAFLDRHAGALDGLRDFSLHWNGAGQDAADWPALWQGLRAELPAAGLHSAQWRGAMRAHGDLAANLLAFARSLLS